MSDDNKKLDDMADDAMENAKKKAENLGDQAENTFDSGKQEAKDLGDKAEEAFNDVKEKASEFGEKASEKFDDAKEKASEFADDAKEAASDFADDVKKEANEFKENVKETFSADNPESGKTVAIIAHLTLIGWIIALIMNNSNKTEIGSFYIRQVLGIFLIGLIISWIPLVNFVGWILVFILWLISFIGSLNGSTKPVFLVGQYFQDWFKSL